MDHGYFKDRISGYLDGELPDYELEAVRQHLEECAECRELYAQLKRVDELVEKHSGLDGAEYWEAQALRIEERLGITDQSKITAIAPKRRWGLGWKLAGVAAAAAVMIFVAINQTNILRQSESDMPATRPAPVVADTPTPGAIPPEDRPAEVLRQQENAADREAAPATEGGSAGSSRAETDKAEAEPSRLSAPQEAERPKADVAEETIETEAADLSESRSSGTRQKLSIEQEALSDEKPTEPSVSKSREVEVKEQAPTPFQKAVPLQAPSFTAPRLAPVDTSREASGFRSFRDNVDSPKLSASAPEGADEEAQAMSLDQWEKRADSLESLWADLDSKHEKLVLPKARKGKQALSDIDMVERQLLEARYNVGRLGAASDSTLLRESIGFFERYLDRPDARHRSIARTYLEQLGADTGKRE